MLMNALLLNPLLTKLAEEVTGLRLDNKAQKVVVTAYADDVTIILRITFICTTDYTYIETLWGYLFLWVVQHKSKMFLKTPKRV